MTNTEKYRERLVARKAEIMARLEEIEAELDSHQSRDWEELATEREGDEVLEHEAAMGKSEIEKIDAALARMDEGEYGYCVKCGAKIDAARLDAVPYTPFCRNCAP